MKKSFRSPLIIACFALFPLAAAGAQPPEGEAADTLTVYAGQMKSISANNPTRVIIGNPAVADVVSVAGSQITVAGKGAGMTNLLWWDGTGERAMRLRVLTEEMEYYTSRANELIKEMGLTGVYAKPADAEGKILLLGSVRTADDIKRITTALSGEIGRKTVNLITVDEEESTVEMDVEVLEVSQDGRRQLGIEWPSSLELTEPADFEKTLKKTPDALFHVSKWTHSAMSAKIDFLVQEGKARMLSRPKLACQSGKEAELLVGGETPVLTTQVSGTNSASSTQVEYKEYGIKLKIAPVVMADAKVKLTIAVEVSDIAETALYLGSANAPTALAYPLSKRNTSTQLVIGDNQTLAISGLIKQQTSEDVKKVPFLGDLPLVGLLFRHKDSKSGKNAGSRGDTELVVMVTPKILKTSAAKPITEEFKPEAKPASEESRAVPAPFVEPASAVQTAVQPVSPAFSVSDYARQVTAFIAGKLVYPTLAKRSNVEGTVNLALHLARSGALLESVISKSSGYAVLDADALSRSKEISPYPVFPDSFGEDEIWIQVPISYKLKKE